LKKSLPALALASLATLLLVSIACNKSNSTGSNTANNTIPPDQMVTASLQGHVVDENGLPVQGAAVTSGPATTTTDINGIFSFTSISMSTRFGYVQVVENGYYTGSRSIITNPGASNFVSIQLVPMAAATTFPAARGGSVGMASGDTATFPANAVVTASTNAAYTGTVHVFANYMDPTDLNLYKYMPGDLRGIGTNGLETALESYGIEVVNLQDDAGNKVQLASGHPATLTFVIPDTLQSSAPISIPLWYFNDSTGRWIQQGVALRIGNSYVGQVTHFTYWTCAVPVVTVNFNARLKDQYGNPIPFTHVYFTSNQSQNGFNTISSYSDSTGYVQGLLPQGESLVMYIVTQCGNPLAGANVGPALQDQNLGNVTVNIVNTTLTLTGSVVNCSNGSVDSGYVNAMIDGLNYRAVVKNGAFTLPIVRCYDESAQVTLTAYDLIGLTSGSASAITATDGNVNAGTLSACH
jgi:hypothetical protein